MSATSTAEPTVETARPPVKVTPSSSGRWLLLALILIPIVWVCFHLLSHPTSESAGARPPTVAVEKVTREDLAQSLTLSAEFHPYSQVALHAKVAGYLKSISVDVGDHVHEGDVIAKLDVPELQDELGKVQAALGAAEEEVTRAEAASTDAHIAYQRLQQVAKEHPKLVAAQDVDSALAKDTAASSGFAATKQRVEEAHSEVARVKALLGYMNIVAPFDGVITRRLADPGALIQAGTSSNTQAMPLVELAEDKKLRLVFPVPESAVTLVNVGLPVKVTVGATGQSFEGNVSRFSSKVDHSTRTMWTEVDVENADGRFKPGMIAEARLQTVEHKDAVAVPLQAVSIGEKPAALVVNAAGAVEQHPLKLGLQTPTKAEVLSGLQPGDLVVVGSRSGLQVGQKVTAKELSPTAE